MNEDLKKAMDALDNGNFDSDSWALIKKTLAGKGDESWTAQEQADLLGKFRDWANSSPEAQKELRQHLKDTATQRFTKQYKPFFNSILQGADIATSLGQINSANTALKSFVQPAVAGSPGTSQELKSQLANAQQGSVAAARAIAPAQQAMEQQYQADLNNAKQASGGNAGSFMANAQAASLAKERAAAGLPAIEDTIQNRYQTRADQLAGAIAQNQQQDFGNRLYGSQLALDQYNRQMQASGHLGATGRLNLRNAIQGVPNSITGIMGQAIPPNSSSVQQTPPPLVSPNEYGKYSNYAESVKRALAPPTLAGAWSPKIPQIDPYSFIPPKY